MKRTILLAAAAAMLLTACSKGDSSDESSKREKKSKETETTSSQEAAEPSEAEESVAEPAGTDSLPDEPQWGELYDTKPISEAYLSGDTSGLDDFQMEIYNAAAGLIDQVITDGMSDVEKELAIHDWMVATCHYDEDELGIFKEMQPHSDDPHGFLIDHRGICAGYSTTFQLMMDMLGIECLTIHSSAHGEEHAWNMVRLEGDWYFVDVTWDDPVPDEEGRVIHTYFNSNEEYFLTDTHEWDPDAYPRATGTRLSYGNIAAVDVEDLDDLPKLVSQQLEKNCDDHYYIFKDSEKLGITEKLMEDGVQFEFDEEGDSWEAKLYKAYHENGCEMVCYEIVKVDRGLAVIPYFVRDFDF